MILVDTGPIVAFFDSSDRYHEICLTLLKDLDGPLLTVWPVITECFFLLNFSWKAQDNLWEFLMRGGIEIIGVEAKEMQRCRMLMDKYKELPMDLADGVIVAVAESKKIKKVFTLDHKDFGIYRPLHTKRFQLIPEEKG